MQLKGRLTFGKKYVGKDLYVAFEETGTWHLYPHDELLHIVMRRTDAITGTVSWERHGGYSFSGLSQQSQELLEPYKVAGYDLHVGDDAAT